MEALKLQNAPDWEGAGQGHSVFLTHQMLRFAGDPPANSAQPVPAVGKMADGHITGAGAVRLLAESLEAWPLDSDPWKATPARI